MNVLEKHVDLAAGNVSSSSCTPHLEDKRRGQADCRFDQVRFRIDPGRVLADHVEEHTAKYVMDAGFWGGLTLYPESKCTSARAIDILENFGSDRLWMNSACDWGVSVPLAVPYAAQEMIRRGYDDDAIDRIFYRNPVEFLSQCPNFKLK